MTSSTDFAPHWFGSFELLRSLGVGGMAEVFLARTTGAHDFEKVVVLKRILPRLRKQKKFVDMFVAEAKRSVQLQHANIVQIMNLDEQDGWPFIVMEHVHGCDLRRIHRKARTLRVPLTFDFSVYCMTEVLKGLEYAHNLKTPDGRALNLVHRDVTPENVYVSYSGEVKLGDFGVAHAVGAVEQGEIRGKLPYCAPEVLQNVEIDQRADVFSAGVVLWEILTGRDCYVGRNPGEVLLQIRDTKPAPPSSCNPQVARDLDLITLKALSRDREQRFQTAQEFEDALADYLFARKLRWSRRKIADVMQALFRDESKPLQLPPRLTQPAANPFSVPDESEFADASTKRLVNVIAGVAPSAIRSDSDPSLELGWQDPDESNVMALVENATQPKARLPLLEAPAPGVEHVRLPFAPAASEQLEIPTTVERVLVWLHDQRAPEPMDLDAVVDVLASRAYEVAGLGGGGEPAIATPELVARLYWDSLVGLPVPTEEPVAADSLESVSVTRLLYEFTLRKMTGLVLFEDATGRHHRLLSLHEGMPLYVYSDAPFDGGLAMLQRYHLIPPTPLFNALMRVANRRLFLDQALIDCLTEEGRQLAPEIVRRAFSAILRIRLHAVFGWRGGRFSVYPNVLRGQIQRWKMAPLLTTLVNAVRRSFALAELNQLLRDRGTQAVVLTSSATRLLPALKLKEADLRTVQTIDGKRAIPQLLQANNAFSSEAQLNVMSLLYVLSETNIAELL